MCLPRLPHLAQPTRDERRDFGRKRPSGVGAGQTSVLAITCFPFALVATNFLLLPIEEIT
jgi:hypothetical protein